MSQVHSTSTFAGTRATTTGERKSFSLTKQLFARHPCIKYFEKLNASINDQGRMKERFDNVGHLDGQVGRVKRRRTLITVYWR